MSKNQDLTIGSPGKVLLNFSIPIFIGNLLQQLYATVDSIVVGNFVGAYALGAVGTTFPITFMLIAVASGLSNGASVLVGQAFGKKEIHKLKRIILICCFYAVVISLVLSGLFYALLPTLLSLIKASPEIYDDALIYLEVYLLGLMFTYVYTMISGIFRALGDSKTPLVFLAISSITNIVLDLVFVIEFNWGVFGVAVATVIAQGLSFVLQLVFLNIKLKHLSVFEQQAEELPKDINAQILKSLLSIVVPSVAQEITIGINIFITQSLVNIFGADASSAYAACGKIENFAMLPMINIMIAMTAFSAQNMGAKQPDRVKKALKYATKFSFIVCIFIALLVFTVPKIMMSIFIGNSAPGPVYEIGTVYMKFMIINLMSMALLFSAEGTLRGSGDVHCLITYAIVGTILKVSVSLFCIYVIKIGIIGIWIGSVFSWGSEAILSRIRVYSNKWQDSSV